MSRASQFIEYINIRNLKEKDPVNVWYKTGLTHITIDEKMKRLRKEYLKHTRDD